jgi:hypothetical protein
MKRRKKTDEVEPLVVDEVPLIPEGGFSPGDFPRVSVAMIPYSSQTLVHPDPVATINTDGWLFIDTGMVRFALPNRDEWNKLTTMIEALWNSHSIDKQKEENNNDGSAVNGQGQSPASVSGNGQQ